MKIILCIIVMQVLGGLGAFLTSGSIDSWYAELKRPLGTPPNWVFGPVWATLYAMIGASFALVWHQLGNGFFKTSAAAVFATQLILNLAWTPAFFGAHQMEIALVIILAMIGAIVMTMRAFMKHSRPAAWLLAPYLIWVCYATYLNAGYALLN